VPEVPAVPGLAGLTAAVFKTGGALSRALPDYEPRAAQIVKNAKALAETLIAGGLDVVSGGTDNHLMLVDLRKKNATGKRAEAALGRAYITCNKNGIPFDPEKPFVTSGVRLGAPAGTTRGFKEAEFKEIGILIVEVLDGLKVANSDEGNAAVEAAVRGKVVELTNRFPMYDYMG
jgi:glycine hydroxymethyltransferase